MIPQDVMSICQYDASHSLILQPCIMTTVHGNNCMYTCGALMQYAALKACSADMRGGFGGEQLGSITTGHQARSQI